MTARPRKPLRFGPVLLSLGASALIASACSDDTTQSTPPPQPEPDSGVLPDTSPPDTNPCPPGMELDPQGQCFVRCLDEYCNPGFRCVNNACTFICSTLTDCGAGARCVPGTHDDGSTVGLCEPDTLPPPVEGGYLWPCPMGDECNDTEEYVCLGSGPGDAEAYCSKFDCHSDLECPAGMYCTVGRSFKDVCNNPNFPAIQPDPGPCIDPAEYTTDGKTYREGPMTLLRNLCVKRRYCAPCEIDADCGLESGQACVKPDDGSPSYCAKPCDPIVGGCPWEGASTCAVTEAARGPTCTPSYGACTGDGAACTPCRSDEDCWSPGDPARKLCLQASFSHERYCVDMDTPCNSDSECAKSPSGLFMDCVLCDEPEYLQNAYLRDQCMQGLLYQRCYPRDNSLLGRGHTSCWMAP